MSAREVETTLSVGGFVKSEPIVFDPFMSFTDVIQNNGRYMPIVRTEGGEIKNFIITVDEAIAYIKESHPG